LKHFPLLAACEFAGTLGLVAGIWQPALGVAGAVVLVIHFVSTTGTVGGIGGMFMKT
jgi:hypothetical protein